jgi:hypothetical protein
MNSLQNFQLPATGSGYSGLSGNLQMANLQNTVRSTTSALHSGNVNDSGNQANNFRNTVKIPAYQQIVTPGVRLQSNPYQMSNQTSYASHQPHFAAPYSGQSIHSYNPVIQQAIPDNTYTIIQNTLSTPLSESQKFKLGVLHSRIRNAERES